MASHVCLDDQQASTNGWASADRHMLGDGAGRERRRRESRRQAKSPSHLLTRAREDASVQAHCCRRGAKRTLCPSLSLVSSAFGAVWPMLSTTRPVNFAKKSRLRRVQLNSAKNPWGARRCYQRLGCAIWLCVCAVRPPFGPTILARPASQAQQADLSCEAPSLKKAINGYPQPPTLSNIMCACSPHPELSRDCHRSFRAASATDIEGDT